MVKLLPFMALGVGYSPNRNWSGVERALTAVSDHASSCCCARVQTKTGCLLGRTTAYLPNEIPQQVSSHLLAGIVLAGAAGERLPRLKVFGNGRVQHVVSFGCQAGSSN